MQRLEHYGRADFKASIVPARTQNGHFWCTDRSHIKINNRIQSAKKATALNGIMIANFFVLSPRGDTIIAKRYRNEGEAAAHERSHTEAFFRKVKFWDDLNEASNNDGTSAPPADSNATEEGPTSSVSTGDAPPIFLMPDGLTYMHVKRNGLIFAVSTARNVSAVTVIEVGFSNIALLLRIKNYSFVSFLFCVGNHSPRPCFPLCLLRTNRK